MSPMCPAICNLHGDNCIIEFLFYYKYLYFNRTDRTDYNIDNKNKLLAVYTDFLLIGRHRTS
jgi:hypothetical protein